MYTPLILTLASLNFFVIVECKIFSNRYNFEAVIAEDFVSCLNKLIDLNFVKPGLLIFANSNNVSSTVLKIRADILVSIHEKCMYSIQILTPLDGIAIPCGEYLSTHEPTLNSELFEYVPVADYFVIIVDDFKDFKILASKLIRSRSWNPRAKFLILFISVDSKNDKIFYSEKMITCLFKFNALNIIVIVPDDTDVRKAIIYGWKPYNPPKYCGYFNESAVDRLEIVNFCQLGIVDSYSQHLTDKVSINVEGCTFYVIGVERQPFITNKSNDPNIERSIIKELENIHKFTAKYKLIGTNRGEKVYGEWTGGMHQLIKKSGQVLIGGIFPDNDIHKDFDTSFQYLDDKYAWVVPKAHVLPKYLSLFIVFQANVWLSLIISFVICVTSWIIFGSISKETVRHRSYDHCSINTWLCTLGFCAYNRPKKNTLRVFFVFLNVYCVLCITAYQTKLFDILKNPPSAHQMQTVEELINSGLKFGGFEELRDLYMNSTDEFDNFIAQQWLIVEDLPKALFDVAVYRNFSVLCSRLELSHLSTILPFLSDEFGNYKYYIFPSNAISFSMEMISLRGLPLMPEISYTISMFKQMGVEVKIRNRFRSYNKIKRALLVNLQDKNSITKCLTLDHLQGGFIVLAFGNVFGTMILFFEIFIRMYTICQK